MTPQPIVTPGKLTVYCGPMYAGKTSVLIAELDEALSEQQTVLVVKPSIDNRYKEDDIVSHDGISLKETTNHPVLCLNVEDVIPEEQLDSLNTLFVDEAQFFTTLVKEQVPQLLERGVDVVVVGLDLDSEGNPFGSMPFLLSLADRVIKMTSTCAVCGYDAHRTFRKLTAKSSSQVLIGGAETYEARCFKHWVEGRAERQRWMA